GDGSRQIGAAPSKGCDKSLRLRAANSSGRRRETFRGGQGIRKIGRGFGDGAVPRCQYILSASFSRSFHLRGEFLWQNRYNKALLCSTAPRRFAPGFFVSASALCSPD